MTYIRPTQRQRELLAAYVATGTVAAASAKLGISVLSGKSHMRNAQARTKMTLAQLIAFGVRDGWLILEAA